MNSGLSDYIQLRELLAEHDYFEAIEQSKKQPVDSFFLAVFQRVNRGKIEEHFWDALFTKEANHLFQSDCIHGIVGKFWSSDRSAEQIHLFSKNHPKVFCQSLRLSKSFLESGFLDRTKSATSNTPYMDCHLNKMQSLKTKWDLLNKEVDESKAVLSSISLETLLAELVIWWENEWSQNMAKQQKLSVVYHTILRAYFHVRSSSEISFHSAREGFKITLNRYKGSNVLSISVLLNAFVKLYEFETTELENYCYEIRHDFNPKGDYRHDKRALLKYVNDGKKLGTFQTYWRVMASELTLKLIESGSIKLNPKNDLEEYVYTSQTQSRLMLEYIGGSSQLDHITIAILSNLETHALSRYRLVMWKLLEEDDIVTALEKLTRDKEGNHVPIQLYNQEDFRIKTAHSLKSKVSLLTIDKVLQRVISSSDDLNMLERPIIRLSNGQILNLMNLTSESNFLLRGYFNMVDAISDKSDRQGDIDFEELITNKLREAGFEAEQGILYNQKRQDGSSGDIDVIVKERNFALILEVKRIKLRYDSEGIWNEREIKTNWASLQLHKASLALEAKATELMEVIPEETEHKVSLIITPWFEYDHEYVGKYLKVSWFEILYALEQLKSEWQSAPNRLKALTNLVTDDRVWPDIFKKADAYQDVLRTMSK